MSADRYPNAPGHRGVDTSEAAANDLAPALGRLQKLTLAMIDAAGPEGRTCEELAELTELPRSTIQPRTSELQRRYMIHDSGMRRRNPSSGKRAIVWVAGPAPAADPAPLPLLAVGGADNDA